MKKLICFISLIFLIYQVSASTIVCQDNETSIMINSYTLQTNQSNLDEISREFQMDCSYTELWNGTISQPNCEFIIATLNTNIRNKNIEIEQLKAVRKSKIIIGVGITIILMGLLNLASIWWIKRK